MTPVNVNLLQGRADAGGQLDAAHDSSTVVTKHEPVQDPRLKQAAEQFEAVLLRQMLTCLEKTTSSSTGGQSSGGSIYGSMVVNAVADAVARAGGFGLASVIAKSVQAPAADASASQGISGLNSAHGSARESLEPQLRSEANTARPPGAARGEVQGQ